MTGSMVLVRWPFLVRSFSDFDSVMGRAYLNVSLNLGYADSEGHIGSILTGEVPIRRGPRGAELMPMAGWTGEHDWDGFISHADLPKLFDPPSGMIISANHKILDQFDGEYPHYLGRSWKSGYRAQAIEHELRQLLEHGGKINVGQMPAVQMNVRSWAAVSFVDELQKVQPEEADAAEALNVLRSWNGTMGKDSVAASLYQITHAELVQRLMEAGCQVKGAQANELLHSFDDMAGQTGFNTLFKMTNELSGHLHLNVLRMLRNADVNEIESAGINWWLKCAGGRDKVVSAALAAAVVRLRALAGKDWKSSKLASWGRLHIAHFIHPMSRALGLPPGSPPLDARSVMVGGDVNTINMAQPKSLSDFTATSGNVSLRAIFDLSDLSDRMTNRAILPLGESGQFNSPHFMDQTQLWSQGGMKPMLIKESDIFTTAKRTMRFQPLV